MNGISMLILSVGGIIAVLFFVTYAAQKHDLNGIKDKTVGNGQHGTARWATRQEVKRTYHHVPYTPTQWRQAAKEGKQPTANGKPLPQGIVLGCQGGRKTTALVDSDDVHVLMIGASGVGKTAYFLYPNLEYACASGMSFLALDTKGDLARNYGAIARDIYGYRISVVDLREPTRSDGNNLLTLINRYMDDHREDPTEITAKAKAEKYAKILAKTIISPEGEGSDHGQNAYFYDAAEGLLASVVLLLSEFLPPEETDGYETRHIASVFKLVQELLMQGRRGGNQFQELMQLLPSEHKAKWLAGSALTASDQAMNSIMSTVLSRLNAFLDMSYRSLNGYEIYLLMLAAHFHDVGNALGREEHEKRIDEIMCALGTNFPLDTPERLIVSNIATAHGGQAPDPRRGKDTLFYVDTFQNCNGIAIRPALLASILRFADELADDNTRANRFLGQIDAIPDANKIYHAYSSALAPISFNGNVIEFQFFIPFKDTQRKIPEYEGSFLYDEIMNRLKKCLKELEYCRKYAEGFIRITTLRVEVNIMDSVIPHRPIKKTYFTLRLSGYPQSLQGSIDSLEFENGEALMKALATQS